VPVNQQPVAWKPRINPGNDIEVSFLDGISLTGDPNGSFLQQGCSETTLKCRSLQQRWMSRPQSVVAEAQGRFW
jgi:hypothetical protein